MSNIVSFSFSSKAAATLLIFSTFSLGHFCVLPFFIPFFFCGNLRPQRKTEEHTTRRRSGFSLSYTEMPRTGQCMKDFDDSLTLTSMYP